MITMSGRFGNKKYRAPRAFHGLMGDRYPPRYFHILVRLIYVGNRLI